MSIFSLFHVNSKPRSAANKMAKEWEARAKILVKRLTKLQSKLEWVQLEMQALSKRMENDLQEAEHVNKLHETAIEALRSENRVLSETVVPNLVAANKLMEQQVFASTAYETRRQVANTPTRDNYED
jgi:hypothetical protein